jgi:LacI family transcriptional regulator
MLEARGIHGLILPPVAGPLPEWQMDWSERAVACIGYAIKGLPDWNRATLAQRESVETALSAMQAKGYRRIGFAIPRESHPDRRSAALSGYYRVRADEPELGQVPLLEYRRHIENFEAPIKDWLEEHRPDAILCSDLALQRICKETGLRIPDDIGIAHLNLTGDVPGWAGIDTHQERQAACALDLAAAQLYRNERGIPDYSKIIQIHGTWRDGYTLPVRA